MLCILNVYSFICQVCLSKAGKKRKIKMKIKNFHVLTVMGFLELGIVIKNEPLPPEKMKASFEVLSVKLKREVRLEFVKEGEEAGKEGDTITHLSVQREVWLTFRCKHRHTNTHTHSDFSTFPEIGKCA